MGNNKAWEYKEHFHAIGMTGDYSGHYEVTNGDISLCTNDDPEDITETENTLQKVARVLNESDCKFYCDTTTEHKLHIENMELRYKMDDLKDQAQRMAGALEMTIQHAKECEELYNISGDAVIEAAEEALQQFKDGKGKEVASDDNFEKWKKENVIVMGEFDFILGNKRIYGKKELRRIYEYLTNPQK